MRHEKRWGWGALLALLVLISSSPVLAQENPTAYPAPDTTEAMIETAAAAEAAPAEEAAPPLTAEAVKEETALIANTVWTLIAGMLVFFMNLGFGALETGLCRRKNAVNILAKNFIVFAISSISFWVIGFALMFGNGSSFVGTAGFMPSLLESDKANFSALDWAIVPMSVKFFFQLVFAGTAATIVSGCVAERIKFGSFLVFSFLIVAFIYPVTGHWIWGGGWLAVMETPFHDFAGSGVVHSVGGWAGLAGIILLGARIGKYKADGSVNPILGHSMALASIGTLILWLGWFGFNPGSTMTASVQIGHIAVTTNMAGACGAVAACLTAWMVLGKPDITMILNGCLAGLVAITAPCAVVSVGGAAVIGIVAGVLGVFAVLFWDKVKIDDPVGALAVHLANGTWGLLAVGLFGAPEIIEAYGMGAYCKAGLFYGGGMAQLITQIIGVLAIAAYVFPVSLIIWAILKYTMGIRVTEQEEREGLDEGEHGMSAYPEFGQSTEHRY